MPDPFQLSAQVNVAPSVQDFSALQSKMDALRSGGQSMQGAAQVDDGWGAVDQSLNIAPKMPVLPPVPEKIHIGPKSFYTGQIDQQYGINSRQGLTDYLNGAVESGSIQPMSESYATRRARETRAAANENAQQRMLQARADAQQQSAYKDQVRQYRASMPEQPVADGPPTNMFGEPLHQKVRRPGAYGTYEWTRPR